MARLEHLDGLRAVLALWVVGNHAWLTIYPTVGAAADPHGLLGLATTWMVYGHFAVVAFIVVSGYSLAISTTPNGARLRGGFRVFLRRRFTRIVLPYWGALTISLILATTVISTDTGTNWDAALPVTTRGVVLHALLLQDFALTGQINHALWSIALEWHIYFFFPLILLLRRHFGLLYATVAVVVVGLLVSAVHRFSALCGRPSSPTRCSSRPLLSGSRRCSWLSRRNGRPGCAGVCRGARSPPWARTPTASTSCTRRSCSWSGSTC